MGIEPDEVIDPPVADGMIGPLPDGSGFFVADVEIAPCDECARAARISTAIGVGLGVALGVAFTWLALRNA